MADLPEPRAFEIAVRWPEASDLPFVAANQALVQFQEGQILITLGHVTPPPILPEDPDADQKIAEMASLPVQPVARVTMPVARAREVAAALNRVCESADQLTERLQTAEPTE